MKHTIAALLLAAAPLVQAAGEWTMSSDKGNIFTLHPESLRVYKNSNGAMQADMLVTLTTTTGKNERHRMGVAGCELGQGEIAEVTIKAEPVGDIKPWMDTGTLIYDWMAKRICGAQKSKSDNDDARNLLNYLNYLATLEKGEKPKQQDYEDYLKRHKRLGSAL